MLVEGIAAGGVATVLAHRAWSLSLTAARLSATRVVRRAYPKPAVSHYCPNKRLETALISPLVTRSGGVVFNVLPSGVGGSTAMKCGLAAASRPGVVFDVRTASGDTTRVSQQFSGALVVDCASILEVCLCAIEDTRLIDR